MNWGPGQREKEKEQRAKCGHGSTNSGALRMLGPWKDAGLV